MTIKWTNEGKLHFVGTAYFEKIDDLAGVGGGDEKGGPSGPSVGMFQITKEKEGVWKIKAQNNSGGALNPLAPPNQTDQPKFDPAKATQSLYLSILHTEQPPGPTERTARRRPGSTRDTPGRVHACRESSPGTSAS